MKKALCVMVAIIAVHGLVSGAETASPLYRIAQRIPVAGEGGWDLLAADSSSGRVFMSHGGEVAVVDVKNGKQLGTIPETNGSHGVALAVELNKGFITCGRDNAVAIFSLDALAVMARVDTGKNPDAIAYDPATQRVFSFNAGGTDATVIDATTNAAVGTVELGGKPELCATDGKGKVFVNLNDMSMVAVIDARELTVKNTWPIAPGEDPTGLALDAENHRLFVGCGNRMMIVMNAENGAVLANLPVGGQVDGVEFDPGLKRAYSSNGEGTLTVVEETTPDSFKVLENVPTQRGARTLALDAATHHIYLPAAEYEAAPAPAADNPRPRRTMVPGSFVLLDVEPVN